MQAIAADKDTELYALGDAFMDQVDIALKKFQGSRFKDRVTVDEGHKFNTVLQKLRDIRSVQAHSLEIGGLSVEDIAEYTDMPLEQVRAFIDTPQHTPDSPNNKS